jgi:hypothetical protein
MALNLNFRPTPPRFNWCRNGSLVKCCPFFEIDLNVEREQGGLWLRLTGREGVKQLIRAEFASWFPS